MVPFPNYSVGDESSSTDRVAIYPNTEGSLYTLQNPGIISGLVSQLSAGTTPGAMAIKLTNHHQFLKDSPTRKVFIVQTPVMYCFNAGFLYRYSDYGYHASIPNSGLNNEMVVGSGNRPFTGLIRRGNHVTGDHRL